MSAMHGNMIIMCEHHQISQDLTKYHQLSPIITNHAQQCDHYERTSPIHEVAQPGQPKQTCVVAF